MIKISATVLILTTFGCGATKIESPKTEHLEATLISEVASVNPGTPFWVGLKLQLEEGWHVNWKNPGDAGLAPTISWELPEGFTAGEIEWPIPERLVVSDFVLFGYEGTVLLPVKITPPATFDKKEVTLTAACDWVVCGDVCVPGEAKLSLSLPVGEIELLTNSTSKAEFVSTMKRIPAENHDWKFMASASDKAVIISTVPMSVQGPNAEIESMTFFPDVQGIIQNDAEQRLSRDEFVYHLEIPRDMLIHSLSDSLKGVLVVKEIGSNSLKKGIRFEVPIPKSSSTRH